MTDSTGRGSRRRGAWGSSRTSSVRSSAVFDDHLYPGPYPPSAHSLRPADSRFSLNEHFAASRREYEFGYDDASSILDRASVLDLDDQEDTVVLDGVQPSTPSGSLRARPPHTVVDRNFYEILCLPRSASLSPVEIRRAYRRLVKILSVDTLPSRWTPVSEALLDTVQVAFETLIEPYRRVDYDISAIDSDSDDDKVDDFGYLDLSPQESCSLLPEEAYLSLTHGETRTTTDLGLRLEPRSPFSNSSRGALRSKWQPATPLDFSLRQSTTLSMPLVGHEVRRLLSFAESIILPKMLPGKSAIPIRLSDPSIQVTGSIHGLLDEPFRLSSSYPSRYQPPGPSVHGSRRLEQLTLSRFLPSVGLKLRQGLFWREPSSIAVEPAPLLSPVTPDTVFEQEIELLSDPAVTSRIATSLDLPDGGEPLEVEACAKQPFSSGQGTSGSSMGLAVHRRVAGGTAFVTIDAGDWTLRPAPECAHLFKFSKAAKHLASRVAPIRNAPTVEAGYTFSSYDMGLRAGRGFTKPAGRGVRSMDFEVDLDSGGSWTASLGATADTLATYLRYGQDLFSSLTPSQTSSLPPGNHTHRSAGIRAEVELGATTQQDVFIALRALKRVGRFTKLGFEIGIAPANLHLSLYWSRLGQRISLPLLLATKPHLNTEAVFWTTVAPFLGLAAAELLYWRPASNAAAKKRRRRKAKGVGEPPPLQEYIAARRAEADELTVVLAGGVEPRQRLERQGGGLVVLSAKYGVRGAAPEEVADVTVAVAALVDDGRLAIPAGLRKSRLFGFWDPAPRRTKVLSVRYSYQGKEQSVEVCGRDELRLP